MSCCSLIKSPPQTTWQRNDDRGPVCCHNGMFVMDGKGLGVAIECPPVIALGSYEAAIRQKWPHSQHHAFVHLALVATGGPGSNFLGILM